MARQVQGFPGLGLVMGRRLRWSLFLLLLALPGLAGAESGGVVAGPADPGFWYGSAEGGENRVNLFYFFTPSCPHCKEATPRLLELERKYPWLSLSRHELGEPGNLEAYRVLARHFGDEARSYPGFFFCNTMLVGFDHEGRTGDYIEERLLECRADLLAGRPLPPPMAPGKAGLSVVTGIDTRGMSLPVITLVIAGLDAFNPCAFFVLLSLLSLLVHARSRGRIFFVGGVFVVFSGLIYFLFMAAWLNLFLLVGALGWVTFVAGAVATLFAVFNIKDYFLFGVGPSLSIPDQAKPGLFQRMRGLLQTDNLPALVVGTLVLAVAVNSYELLCTSGLPMVYTRLLTLEALPTSSYYLYLAAYNLIYVLPLLTIVTAFGLTLGNRKLQASEGRLLKLLSGLMMLGLGLVLMFAPDRLQSLWVSGGLLLGAVALTGVAWLAQRRGG
jgi:thiol-disulfide isomerase/thioredoxin